MMSNWLTKISLQKAVGYFFVLIVIFILTLAIIF